MIHRPLLVLMVLVGSTVQLAGCIFPEPAAGGGDIGELEHSDEIAYAFTWNTTQEMDTAGARLDFTTRASECDFGVKFAHVADRFTSLFMIIWDDDTFLLSGGEGVYAAFAYLEGVLDTRQVYRGGTMHFSAHWYGTIDPKGGFSIILVGTEFAPANYMPSMAFEIECDDSIEVETLGAREILVMSKGGSSTKGAGGRAAYVGDFQIQNQVGADFTSPRVDTLAVAGGAHKGELSIQSPSGERVWGVEPSMDLVTGEPVYQIWEDTGPPGRYDMRLDRVSKFGVFVGVLMGWHSVAHLDELLGLPPLAECDGCV